MATYFTLAVRDNAHSDWTLEFGAYEREDVEFELDDKRNHPATEKGTQFKIIRHKSDLQADLEADYLALNGHNPDKVIIGNI